MSYVCLDRCDGPECPNCGCQDCEILQAPAALAPGQRRWWASGRARCRNCGQRFAFDEMQNEGGEEKHHGETEDTEKARKSPSALRDLRVSVVKSPPKSEIRNPKSVLSILNPPPLHHQQPPITAADPDPDAAVPYTPVRCPACGSTDVRVTSTKRPVRRHKCRKCGATFKSVERN